jgi:hypothetical protein
VIGAGRRAIHLAAAAAFAACAASAAAQRPTGDAAGLALLEKVHASYRDVPGVTGSAHVGPARFRFTLVLSAGVAVGEEVVVSTPAGTTTFVARAAAPTFTRERGASCWRQLAASDPEALDDLGFRFPDAFRVRVDKPRRTADGWLLSVATWARGATKPEHEELAIDGTTYRVRTLAAEAGGTRVVERLNDLASSPTLPQPRPLC